MPLIENKSSLPAPGGASQFFLGETKLELQPKIYGAYINMWLQTPFLKFYFLTWLREVYVTQLPVCILS